MAQDTVGVQIVSPDGRKHESLAFRDPYQAAEWLLEQCSLAELQHLHLMALRRIKARVAAAETAEREAKAA